MAGPRSLFAKTGITLALSFGVLLVVSSASLYVYLLNPMARQAADDLAAFMVLSVQAWVELPPDTRPLLEQELRDEYQMELVLKQDDLPPAQGIFPAMRYLKTALEKRLGHDVEIMQRPGEPLWYCVDIPMGGRQITACVPPNRVGASGTKAVIMMLSGGALVVLLTALYVVRRLTRPLARLAQATDRIGRGELVAALPEEGPRELITLTRRFNRMSSEIAALLDNRTTLLAGMSHDLRTPLTRMRISLEILSDNSDPVLMEGLIRDIEAMDRLVTSTMELARGLAVRELQEVHLRELVDGIVVDYRQQGHEVIWDPTAVCIVEVDAVSIRRVLMNLMGNAFRYAGKQPVEVQCFCRDGNALLRVLDRGPGMPEQELERIFQPFRRLEASRSRATGGSGLGLAITRQLCAAQGWDIKLMARDGGGLVAQVMIPGDQLISC